MGLVSLMVLAWWYICFFWCISVANFIFEQDPYFRMTRDAAVKLKLHKPSLIESQFFPALQVFPLRAWIYMDSYHF
jgi:hypothetical protein